MKMQRSNVLAFGPMPVAWLCIPLTQERTAALVRFEERTGYPIIDALTDALDDIVSNIGPDRQPGATDCRPGVRPAGEAERSEFASSGGVPCVQPTRSESGKPEKSNVKSCEAMQDFAEPPNSAFAGKPYSRRLSTNQPPSLPAEQARASEQPNMNSAATTIHQHNQFEHSSMNACRRGDDYCRND